MQPTAPPRHPDVVGIFVEEKSVCDLYVLSSSIFLEASGQGFLCLAVHPSEQDGLRGTGSDGWVMGRRLRHDEEGAGRGPVTCAGDERCPRCSQRPKARLSDLYFPFRVLEGDCLCRVHL